MVPPEFSFRVRRSRRPHLDKIGRKLSGSLKGVKYLLMIYMNPTLFETLSEDERNEIFAGHDAFQKPLRDSGELLGFAALGDPSTSITVRVRGVVRERAHLDPLWRGDGNTNGVPTG
jgi:hypothetical protein